METLGAPQTSKAKAKRSRSDKTRPGHRPTSWRRDHTRAGKMKRLPSLGSVGVAPEVVNAAPPTPPAPLISSVQALQSHRAGGLVRRPSSRTTVMHRTASRIRIVAKTSELQIKPRRRNLKALSGLRTLATLWIVLGHFQQTAAAFGGETFVLVLGRGYIPVCMYIVLSGFVTHYAYKSKVYDRWGELAGFYARRMARVLFTYYASILLGLVDPLFTRHDARATTYPEQTLATVFLVQSWFELPHDDDWQRSVPTQPNPAGWTISTLIFAWLLYPALNAGMRAWNQRVGTLAAGKVGLAALCYAATMLPCIIMYAELGGDMSNGWFELLYKYPPLRLGDFCLGMVLAELVDYEPCNSLRVWRLLPDLSLVVFGLIVTLVQLNGTLPLERDDAEAFFISGLAPLLGIMLLGYSINSDRNLRWSLSAVLEHAVLIEIGNWSFAVYCFQFTLYYMVEQWQFRETGYEDPDGGHEAPLVAPFLLPYLLALYALAAVWTEVLEKPFARRVKIWTSRVFGRRDEGAAQGAAQGGLGTSGRTLVVASAEKSGTLGDKRGRRQGLDRKHSARVQGESADSKGGFPAGEPAAAPFAAVTDVSVRLRAPKSQRNLASAALTSRALPVPAFATVRSSRNVLHEADDEGYEGNDDDADGDDDDDVERSADAEQVHLDIELLSEAGESCTYESDPEYERTTTSYDYIQDTDSEGDVEIGHDAMHLVKDFINTALERHDSRS